jgi:L-seryl-tRNA(Ser) seleniumtransferase
VLCQSPAARVLEARYGRAAVVDALRLEASRLRDLLRRTGPADLPVEVPQDADAAAERLLAAASLHLAAALTPSLRPVLNATGVIVHTNLGRAPLSRLAVERLAAVATGYSNLEYDLEVGARGRRDSHAEALLTRLTGSEAAVVVNNNAAATLLMLTSIAQGREVVISRGELVEIGGGFRVPDIMAQSGAVLREVGTTNRTRLADYAAAIGERTALILRVHPSNFRIDGFTERPSLGDLAALAHEHGLPLAEDLGSGYLGFDAPEATSALRDEPTVGRSLAAGVDILCFSGDKLLGGPQSGILLGRASLVGLVRTHPLMRALRVDKLTYAALEATLIEWVAGRALQTIPVARMIGLTRDDVEARARRLQGVISANARLRVSLRDGSSTVGGGSAPGSQLPTCLLVLEQDGLSADALEARLRAQPVPIIARIEQGHVVLDLRSVPEEDDEALARGLAAL